MERDTQNDPAEHALASVTSCTVAEGQLKSHGYAARESFTAESSLASHQQQKKQKRRKHPEMKSICCKSISIFHLLISCLVNAGTTA